MVRKFGIQKYDASWDAKGKAYKCFGKCVGKFRPAYLYALIGLAIYLLFLWVYYHSLYAPSPSLVVSMDWRSSLPAPSVFVTLPAYLFSTPPPPF